MGLIDSFRARLELYRLEQRYARRDKRTTWYSDAKYVDGEYVFCPNPDRSIVMTTTTTSSSDSSSPAPSPLRSKMSMPSVRLSEVFGSRPVISKRASRAF